MIKSLSKGQQFINTMGAIITILNVDKLFVTYRVEQTQWASCTEINSCLRMLNQNYYFEKK